MKTKKRTKQRKRFHFLWFDVDAHERKPHSDCDKDWHSRIIRAATIERACEKMLKFIRSCPFNVAVDYEAAALHVRRYNPEKHEETFPDLRETELEEYVW